MGRGVRSVLNAKGWSAGRAGGRGRGGLSIDMKHLNKVEAALQVWEQV